MMNSTPEHHQALDIVIRSAAPSDAPYLIDFNICLARESEDKILDPATITREVQRCPLPPAVRRACKLTGHVHLLQARHG